MINKQIFINKISNNLLKECLHSLSVKNLSRKLDLIERLNIDNIINETMIEYNEKITKLLLEYNLTHRNINNVIPIRSVIELKSEDVQKRIETYKLIYKSGCMFLLPNIFGSSTYVCFTHLNFKEIIKRFNLMAFL